MRTKGRQTACLPLFTSVLLVVQIAACGEGRLAGSGPAVASGDPLEGKEQGAPFTLSYSVVGNAVVGRPIGIDIEFENLLPDRPATITYRASEAGSITFPAAQPAQFELVPVDGGEQKPLQINVVPQRDGRVFLGVAVAVETDTGSVVKSMAIPLQVARAPAENDAA